MSDEDKEKDATTASEATANEADVSNQDADAVDDGLTPEEGIADLRKSIDEQRRMLEEERRLRLEAERAAYEARVQAVNNDQQLKASHYHEVQSRINFAIEREKALMQEWTDAKSMGDYAREAEVQKVLIQNSNDLRALEQAKGKLEQLLRQPVQTVAPPNVSAADEWIEQVSDPRDKEWIRKNGDRITPAMKQRIHVYHAEATENGLEASTPEYYRFIEERAGWRKNTRRDDDYEDDDDGVMSAASKPRRSAPPPSAPVTRGGDRKGTVRLSQEEREIAKLTGQTDEQYYRNKMRDQKRA